MDETEKKQMAVELKASILRMRDEAKSGGLDQTAAGRKLIAKNEKLIRDYGLDSSEKR